MHASDLKRLQAALVDEQLDGWLLYDFQGRSPLAAPLTGLDRAPLSRRWFMWVPRQGQPVLLRHALDATPARHVRGEQMEYLRFEDLQSVLRALLAGSHRVAMEYAPHGHLPAASFVDGGTLDLVRASGVEVVSSAGLAQSLFTWTPQQLLVHRAAAQALTEVKDAALAHLHAAVRQGQSPDELTIQAVMVNELLTRNMAFDHPPIVAFGRHSSDPHYSPDRSTSARLQPGDAILLDLWCKVPGAANPYADITWMAVCGEPGAALQAAFQAVREARDQAVQSMHAARANGQTQRGFEVDRAVQAHLGARGYAQALRHRTGHSLGTTGGHGHAVHLDDFETHDDRPVIAGLGLTVEPGVYLADFGVRSEIDVYVRERGVEITSAVQQHLDVVD